MLECSRSNNTANVEDCTSNPGWLTKDYMQEKLRSFYKDSSLEVLSMAQHSAIGKGENYGGILQRVTIEYKSHNFPQAKKGSYIVKSSLDYGEFAAAYEPYDVFNREMGIYQHILPKLKSLLWEIGDTEKMFPETIAVDYDHSSIIFEDLVEQKYTMRDRLKGLDAEHAKICLAKLAKMHATSVVLNEREPGIFVTYDRGFFNRHTDSFKNYHELVLEACGRAVSKWEGFEKYGRKLIALKPKLMEYAKQVFDLTEGHLHVFAHGDFWTNNIMFKDEAKDAIILDFQFSCWGSPAIDLHYFFNTSLNEDLRMNHLDELIQCYHGILSETLKALRFRGQIPTLHKFHLCLAEKGFYALTSACLVQPLLINDQTSDASWDVLLGDDDRSLRFKSSLFQNVKVQAILKNLLPVFDSRGLLDLRD